MPELSNIQTYEKIEGINYKPVLERFSKILKNIGLWNNEIENAFGSFVWDVEDNGFVYSFNDIEPIASKFSEIKIRPLVMGWTSSIDPTFKDNWISCDLLIETENLRSLNSSNGDIYYPYVFELINSISKELAKEFHQTGIYFTDEGQDGQDFGGITKKDKSKLWQFDYALIPFSLETIYSEVPTNYLVRKREKFIEALRMEVWGKKIVESF
jgi:hypothetical protein